jgi:hypothetical protein
VRRVFHQEQVMILTNFLNSVQVRRNNASHVHKDDNLAVGLNASFEVIGIHLEVLRLAIDKNKSGPGRNRGCRGGDKGMAGQKDSGIANIDRFEDHLDRTCSGHHPDRVLDSAELGKLALKSGDIFAHADETPLKHAFKALCQPGDISFGIFKVKTRNVHILGILLHFLAVPIHRSSNTFFQAHLG